MLQMKYHQCKDKFHIPLGNEYNPWSWGSVTVIISPNYILDSLWVCIFVSLESWVLLRNTSVNEKYLQQKTNLCRATVLNWYFKLWKLRKYFNDQKDIYSFSSVSYLFFLHGNSSISPNGNYLHGNLKSFAHKMILTWVVKILIWK